MYGFSMEKSLKLNMFFFSLANKRYLHSHEALVLLWGQSNILVTPISEVAQNLDLLRGLCGPTLT